MPNNQMHNREAEPTLEYIRQLIGSEVWPIWEEIQNYLAVKFSQILPETVFYNPQRGWGLRYRVDAQQICILFPEEGSFTALITLNSQEEQGILDMLHYFNAKIRDLLNKPSSLPSGRWIWLQIEDRTDATGFKLLLNAKSP